MKANTSEIASSLATDSYLETTAGVATVSSGKNDSSADLSEVVVKVDGEKGKASVGKKSGGGLDVFAVEKFPNGQSPAILTPTDVEIKKRDGDRLAMKEVAKEEKERTPVEELEKVHLGTTLTETKI
jgi:hypothetical protein